MAAVTLDNGASGRSNTRPQIGALLRNGASDGRALHLPLGIDNNTCTARLVSVDESREELQEQVTVECISTCVIFEIKEKTIPSPEAFALPNNNARHNLQK